MIKSLTSLRGVFILFIFFHHCLNLYPGGGSMAVAFFFVLGGFSMTLGYKDRVMKSDFNYKQYIMRRCIKFYPLHWLCLLAVLPLSLLPLSLYKGIFLLANVTLTHTLIPLKAFYFSYNAVSWYLADTMFFAVLFPFLLKWILGANTKVKATIAICFAIIYSLVAIFIPVEMHHAILYISPYIRLSDFVFGVFLALGYLKLKEKPIVFLKNNILTLSLVLILVVLLVVESCMLSEEARLFAPVYWPLVALLILIASLSEVNSGVGKILSSKILLRLGNLSFSLFLIHFVVLRWTTKVFEYYQIEQPVIYIILTLMLSLVLSDVVERYILNHVTQWLTKKIQPSMTARS